MHRISPGGVVGGLLLVFATGGCSSFPWRYDGPPARTSAREVTTLNPRYERTRSRVLIRKIARPTRANLDYAAYEANVMLLQPKDERVGRLDGARIPRQPFGGVVDAVTLCGALAQTPLSASERATPLAFSPMVDYLMRWSAAKSQGLEQARTAVRAEAWGKTLVPGLHYQQISLAYIHRPRGGQPELWLKIEFQPWARLFDQLPDDDADGFPALYGRLSAALVSAEVLQQLDRDYSATLLDAKAVRAWGNELASYWYPSYNTDIVDPGDATSWPLSSTEPEVQQELGGIRVDRPALLMRGKPQGQAIYNVFVVAGATRQAVASTAGLPQSLRTQLGRLPVLAEPEGTRDRLRDEVSDHGGSWKRWAGARRATHAVLARQLRRRAKRLQALIGAEGFLFYRKSLDYIVGGDVQEQPKVKNPLPTIVEFQRYLACLNIDFLLVPVPTKAEVFPDLLPGLARQKQPSALIHPFGRKFLLELAEAGVEVVDLLQAFLRARKQRDGTKEPLYQPQDTHWGDRGLRLAARLIGQRIKRYGWYPQLERHAIRTTLERIGFEHPGDLHSRLADHEQRRFAPQKLVAHKVVGPDGTLYEDDPNSPIVVLGDSFTGVYQRTDPEHAGVSAHIAHEISFPVDLVMSYGGGPNVRKKLLSRGKDSLRTKRLLVWILTARDFHNYWEDWEPLAAILPKSKNECQVEE